MKFLIDADCPRSLGEPLRKAGHEVDDIRDLRAKADDPEINQLIREKSYILITRDLDFSNLDRYPLTSQCGVILLRTLFLSPPTVASIVEDVIAQIPEQRILGSLIVARPGRYRIFRY